MVRQQFETQMRRLIKVFGESRYPSDRIEIFWDRFRHVDNDTFTRCISRLIADEPHAPLMSRIHDEIRNCGGVNYRLDQIEALIKKQNCSICKNTGRYSTKNKSGAANSWACNCALGKFAFPLYPREKRYEFESGRSKKN